MLRTALLAALAALALAHALAPVSLNVFANGGGDFTSIQAALDSLSPGTRSVGPVTLNLNGTFNERVRV
jgi:pectin methylesterase-like acyl-CoA thioesterase